MLIIPSIFIDRNAMLEIWLWEEHSVLVLFLPAQAPEWNPIELMWNCLTQVRSTVSNVTWLPALSFSSTTTDLCNSRRGDPPSLGDLSSSDDGKRMKIVILHRCRCCHNQNQCHCLPSNNCLFDGDHSPPAPAMLGQLGQLRTHWEDV